MAEFFLARDYHEGDGTTTQHTLRWRGLPNGNPDNLNPYISSSDVHVWEVSINENGYETYGAELTATVSGDQVTLDEPVSNGVLYVIQRQTQELYPITDFENLATVREADLDALGRQALFLYQEEHDRVKRYIELDSVIGATTEYNLDQALIRLSAAETALAALQAQANANSSAVATKIGDAPADGQSYARENNGWVAFQPGRDGEQGDSAYEVWLSQGNSGSEQVFLDSLVGDRGPEGPQGPTGASIPVTGTVPTSGDLPATGSEGEGYIAEDTGILWIWSVDTSQWIETVQIAGQDGKTVLNGTGAPGNGLGTDGDFYIDTAAWDIYEKEAGMWSLGTSLVGPPGEDGQDGAPGADGQDGADGAPASGFGTPYNYVATAGQTTFTADYTPGYVLVFLNGYKLPPADYTATSGTEVVLPALVAGDIVEIWAFDTFEVADAVSLSYVDNTFVPLAEAEYLTGSPYCTDSGGANTYTLAVNYTGAEPTAYRAGDQYRFRAGASNTGASTVTINGLGAKTLVTVTGVALPAGYIRTDVDTTITYDAANDRFVAGREMELVVTATGGYQRYAEGKMRAWGGHYEPSTSGSGVFVNATVTFPAAFADEPRVLVGENQPTNTLLRTRAQLLSATSGDFEIRYATVTDGDGGSYNIPAGVELASSWSADGLWYSS